MSKQNVVTQNDAQGVVYQQLPVNAPVAIMTPNSVVQLSPIVQPIALVPYNTMNQPVLQYGKESK